jgi:hypothetical protein
MAIRFLVSELSERMAIRFLASELSERTAIRFFAYCSKYLLEAEQEIFDTPESLSQQIRKTRDRASIVRVDLTEDDPSQEAIDPSTSVCEFTSVYLFHC